MYGRVRCHKCTTKNPLAHTNKGNIIGISGGVGSWCVDVVCLIFYSHSIFAVAAAMCGGAEKYHCRNLCTLLSVAAFCPHLHQQGRKQGWSLQLQCLPLIWIVKPFGLPEVFSLVRYFRTFNSRATIGIAGCWALGESGTCLGVRQWTKPFGILALWSDEPLQAWPCHSWKYNLGGGQFCRCL